MSRVVELDRHSLVYVDEIYIDAADAESKRRIEQKLRHYLRDVDELVASSPMVVASAEVEAESYRGVVRFCHCSGPPFGNEAHIQYLASFRRISGHEVAQDEMQCTV